MRVRRTVAALLAVLVSLAACSDSDTKPTSQRTGPEKPYTGPMVKEAWSALGGGHSRIEMKQVERRGDRSVLRFYLTNPGKKPDSYSFATSVAGSAFGNLHLMLLDPVGHKVYTPLYDKNGDGKTVGSNLFLHSAYPGARYETVLAFPPLPKSLERITVITPTTAGEFTGVPVVDGKGPIAPTAPTPELFDHPKPGTELSWPVRKQNGPAKGGVYDLYGITEGDVKTTTTSGTEQKVGLRTDVLFAFDKATLSPQAKAVLDEVAAQTKAEADPAKPPIMITGHTDGKGSDEYNASLSQRRAEAVLKELQARLGTGYQYKAEGKGETEPVAEEGGPGDEEARRKNRRVEISYQIKQRTTETSTTSSRKVQEHVGGGGAPAPFHPDGKTVASRTASFGMDNDDKRRIDVKPFYRDGAYLVAVFEIANLGPEGPGSTDDYDGDSPGNFGAFSVADPATNTVYRGVRIGPQPPGTSNINYVDPGWVIFRNDPGTTNRGFFYVPAPPPTVKTVTFNAGPFGTIPNVPIH